MERNLAALRQLVYDRLDWAPNTSQEQNERTNRAINRALLQLAKDCPDAFFQATGYFQTQPDAIPTLSTDVLSVAATGNAWVLETVLTQATTGALQIPTDRTWDGRTIELTDSEGIVHRLVIRSVFAAAGNRVRFSLYTPWANTTDTSIPYRVVTDSYYFPDSLLQMKSMQIIIPNNMWPLSYVGQDQAENYYWNDYSENVASGPPQFAYRRSPYKLPAPTKAPEVEAGLSWIGPDAGGEFEYCYTYVWGLRRQDWQDPGPLTSTSTAGVTGRFEALWESAPSPISDPTTITYGAAGALLTFPDIGYMQGFGDVGNARYQQSGWHIRIYRRRSSAVGGSYENVETPNAFYYLTELNAGAFQFNDRGTLLPDYHRRLRTIHGYQGVMFFPRPDQEYTVQVRYACRPETLVDDYDTPMVYPEATDSIIFKACVFMYESQGNMPLRDRMEIDYNAELVTLQNRYGDLRPPSVPIRRRIASARRPVTIKKWW